MSGVRKRKTNALKTATALDDIVRGHVYKVPTLLAVAGSRQYLPTGVDSHLCPHP